MRKMHTLWVPGADPDRDATVARQQEQADICLHIDPERRGVMWNFLNAVQCAVENDGDLKWSVIIQDDAEPLPGWEDHLAQACWYSPEPVLGLTHFGQYGKKALAKGAPYALGRSLIWGGAVAYRRDFLLGLAEWGPRIYAQTGFVHDDYLVCAYAYRIGRKCALTSRAIFDQTIKKSLLGHGGPTRSPVATITNCSGPAYSVLPRGASIGDSMPPGTKELAAMP